jgi:hypothetical protein
MVVLDDDFRFEVLRHVEAAVSISQSFYPKEVAQRTAEFDVTDKHGYVVHNPHMQCDLTDEILNKLKFIAHAREDVPKLVAEIRALREKQGVAGKGQTVDSQP